MTNRTIDTRGDIVHGLLLAAVLIAVALASKHLPPAYLSPNLARRLPGVLMGAVVVFYANAVPKRLTSLIESRCDPIAGQAIRRFTGWTLVLGGAGYAIAWVIAPLTYADVLAPGILGTAVLLVIVRFAWAMRGKRHV